MSLPYGARSLEERLACAMVLKSDHVTVRSLLRALGGLGAVASAATLHCKTQPTLLHRVAEIFGRCLRGDQAYTEEIQECTSLLQEVVKAGVVLHKHEPDTCRTPLWMLLSNACHSRLRILSSVQKWVMQLRDAGFDLQTYGTEEHAIWEASPRDSRPCIGFSPGDNRTDTHTVLGFAYGPNPTDWHLQIHRRYWVDIWGLQFVAGAWPLEFVPNKILWQPKYQEELYGIWKHVRQFILYSAPCDPQEEMTRDSRQAMLSRAQDDFGEVVRLTNALRKHNDCERRRPRSKSVSALALNQMQDRLSRRRGEVVPESFHYRIDHPCEYADKERIPRYDRSFSYRNRLVEASQARIRLLSKVYNM